MNMKNKLLRLIRNNYIHSIIVSMQILSFSLANLCVIIIYDHFMLISRVLDYPNLYYKIIVYSTGFFLAVIIVKIDWALKIIDKISNFYTTIKNKQFNPRKMRLCKDPLDDTVSSCDEHESHIDPSCDEHESHIDPSCDEHESRIDPTSIRKIIKLLIVIPRWLFFNVLKDGFVITIVWVVYINVTTWFDIINYPSDISFSHLVGSISLIGIISGFFQLYINTYQNTLNSKIQNDILKYVKSKCENITPREFYDFWSTYNRSSKLKDRYKEFIEKKNNTIDHSTLEQISHQRNLISMHFHNTVLPSKVDIFTTMSNFEWIIQSSNKLVNESSIEELFDVYENYFKHRSNEFKKGFNVTDFNSDIPIQCLSIICFYDDLLIDIMGFDTHYAENPKSFNDYYINFINDCVMYTINTLTENGI